MVLLQLSLTAFRIVVLLLALNLGWLDLSPPEVCAVKTLIAHPISASILCLEVHNAIVPQCVKQMQTAVEEQRVVWLL